MALEHLKHFEGNNKTEHPIDALNDAAAKLEGLSALIEIGQTRRFGSSGLDSLFNDLADQIKYAMEKVKATGK